MRSAPDIAVRCVTAPARRPGRQRTRAGFTLVELLASIAVIAVLVSLLAPSLAAAREAGRRAVCASNLRQLQVANVMYADGHRGHYAPGAPDFLANLSRWHGARDRPSEPFDGARGPLVPYFDGERAGAALRTCPTFAGTLRLLRERGEGFERSSGGYGYNNAFVGQFRVRAGRVGAGGGEGGGGGGVSVWAVRTDLAGAQEHVFASPSTTVAFADAAIAAGMRSAATLEYSFAEPRFWPDTPGMRTDPSVHFRHGGSSGAGAGWRGRANVVWLDTHVSAERMTASMGSGLYAPDPAEHGVGWFGETDDNALFDYD